MSRTDWLLPYENPLKKRKGREFFSRIPRTPGVYFMYGPEGCLLYVGKAKNLRERLNSYRHAKPNQVPRKVIRLLNLIQEIKWEECESEQAALLRENQLLRDLKPPFNTINKNPESYYFIGLKIWNDQVRFRLTCSPKKQGDILFGAFKGRRLARDAYAAFLRLLWITQYDGDRFEFPQKLIRRSPAYLYTMTVPADWHPLLKQFYYGTDENAPPLLLQKFTESFLANPKIPAFYYAMIQDDLDLVRDFYIRGPRRNRLLRVKHGIRGRIIAQERIDDFLVIEQQEKSRLAPASISAEESRLAR